MIDPSHRPWFRTEIGGIFDFLKYYSISFSIFSLKSRSHMASSDCNNLLPSLTQWTSLNGRHYYDLNSQSLTQTFKKIEKKFQFKNEFSNLPLFPMNAFRLAFRSLVESILMLCATKCPTHARLIHQHHVVLRPEHLVGER